MNWLHIFLGEASNNSFIDGMHVLPVCLDIALVVCAFNLLCFLYRVLRGPALADRAVAMDSCGITVLSLIIIYSMRRGDELYMSCVLVIAILGFIGMVGLSKYLQSGNIASNSNVILDVDEAEELQESGDVETLQEKVEAVKQKAEKNQIVNAQKQRAKQDHHNKRK